MAEGFAMDDTLGFCTEYMARFTPTTRRIWDSKEDQSMYNEVMEGSWQIRPMSEQFRQWAHDFMLENSTHLAPWRRFMHHYLFLRLSGINCYSLNLSSRNSWL
jgi:hypothetical protein